MAPSLATWCYLGSLPRGSCKTFCVCQIRNTYKQTHPPLFFVPELTKRTFSEWASRNLTKNTRSLSLNHPKQGNSTDFFLPFFCPPADEIFIAQRLQKEKVFCMFCIPNAYFPWYSLRGQQNYQAVLMSQEVMIYGSALRDAGFAICVALCWVWILVQETWFHTASRQVISFCYFVAPSSAWFFTCCSWVLPSENTWRLQVQKHLFSVNFPCSFGRIHTLLPGCGERRRESQKHRISWVSRHPQGSSSPSHGPAQDILKNPTPERIVQTLAELRTQRDIALSSPENVISLAGFWGKKKREGQQSNVVFQKV